DPDRAFGLGPYVFHPWRIAAGVSFGLAAGVKWSAVPFLVAFTVLVFLWDMGARRKAEVQFPYAGAGAQDGVATVLRLRLGAGITYGLTWSGWLLTSGGWGRGKVASNLFVRFFEGLPDLWRYHQRVWEYHTTLTTKHPYQSWPWDWPVLRRPVAFFYTESTTG